jgi:hypothetical protein
MNKKKANTRILGNLECRRIKGPPFFILKKSLTIYNERNKNMIHFFLADFEDFAREKIRTPVLNILPSCCIH